MISSRFVFNTLNIYYFKLYGWQRILQKLMKLEHNLELTILTTRFSSWTSGNCYANVLDCLVRSLCMTHVYCKLRATFWADFLVIKG